MAGKYVIVKFMKSGKPVGYFIGSSVRVILSDIRTNFCDERYFSFDSYSKITLTEARKLGLGLLEIALKSLKASTGASSFKLKDPK